MKQIRSLLRVSLICVRGKFPKQIKERLTPLDYDKRESWLMSQFPDIPQGDLLTTLWPVYYIGPLFPVKSNALSLLEYSGYGFAFLAHKASAKATICGLIEYHYHGTPHNMLLTSNSLYSQRNMTVSSRSWKPLVLPCSPSSWSSWPDRKMEWSFQEKVTVTLRWQQTGGMDML